MLAGVVTPANADGEENAASPWSATIAFTSDYRFRGISQTDTNPAASASIDYTGSQGIFVGAWASNVDFADGSASWELDLYAGYTQEIMEGTEGTIKVVYYAYPDSDPGPGNNDFHYLEVIGSVSQDLDGVNLSLELAYSPDYFGATGKALAVTGGIEAPLVESMYLFDGGLSASAHAGHQFFDENAMVGLPDYTYYDVGLSATAGIFTLDVRYVGTDLSEIDCGADWCDGTVVVTGSLALGG